MVLSALVNKPNRILEKQKFIQASKKPLHYRMPRSGLYLSVYYSAFTVGCVGIVYSCYNLIRGKSATE
ncbi:hypothetical protein BDM02DRAFT_3184234 [Thelephora ganbajun]|uniref:Uncharacterized protein n=1 Tax=Thelephora ganbajun TaxID=370292 RepID=A0ACB6ZQK4_THEGA|nr:hypothetical protein BDM02DRAFT_3184234 [Thelephora ganbajun]